MPGGSTPGLVRERREASAGQDTGYLAALHVPELAGTPGNAFQGRPLAAIDAGTRRRLDSPAPTQYRGQWYQGR
ncbi:hypothetical protein OK351_06625 [Glutamicibacter sp. MNS18]|uniref:hypothetical protein n=1 Tax=Glutamicibacter sp. MNS18 TaxID=2989817 RepID=UPI002236BB58|nr:hypothetical protein [Glutamicibacter sp. MNS18]MCW4465176.1 hypothetical protein [Glutamicibacter sp. MNS18]